MKKPSLPQRNNFTRAQGISLALFLFCLSACSKSTQQSKPYSLKQEFCSAKSTTSATSILNHAKQSDIPVPLGFKPQSVAQQNETSTNSLRRYVGPSSVAQCHAFYKQEMELNGWIIQDLSVEVEGLLVCKKRAKTCSISIRPEKSGQTQLSVFLRTPQKTEEQVVVNANHEEIVSQKPPFSPQYFTKHFNQSN